MLKRAILICLFAGTAAGCGDRDTVTAPSQAVDSKLVTQHSVPVSNTAELLAAISSGNGGTVVLAPGDYELSSPLNVPDGTTLTGSGVMTYDAASGLPTGIDPASRSVLRASATLAGDVVVLGDHTALRGVTIQDAPGRTGGSVVVVHSRSASDQVRADLSDCEVINPNPPSGSLQSVGGRGLVVLTRNRATVISAFAPEVGARVTVNMSHCIIRSPLIAGIFVNNFSPLATVKLVLTENVIGGGMQVTGGTSRPDSVYGSAAIVESRGNLYRADPGSSPVNGLQIYGGAGLPAPGIVQPVTNNTARFFSTDDRIEGFANAIVARGGSRPLASSASISFNNATVELHNTTLSSLRADFSLAGAASLVSGTWPDSANLLSVLSRGVTGSGQRSNVYANVVGPPSTVFGPGNRPEIVGSLQAFIRSNAGIMPPPPAEFFTSSH